MSSVSLSRSLSLSHVYSQETTDRDLRQKRLLIEDYQRKLKLAQSSNTAKEEKIVRIAVVFVLH